MVSALKSHWERRLTRQKWSCSDRVAVRFRLTSLAVIT